MVGFGVGLVGYGSDASEEDINAFANIAGALLGLLVGWLYFAFMESSARQATRGKMVIRARVTDEHGGRISFRQATLRYFAKAISALILCVGFVMIAFTERRQGLHDKIARTLVVRDPQG